MYEQVGKNAPKKGPFKGKGMSAGDSPRRKIIRDALKASSFSRSGGTPAPKAKVRAGISGAKASGGKTLPTRKPLLNYEPPWVQEAHTHDGWGAVRSLEGQIKKYKNRKRREREGKQ